MLGMQPQCSLCAEDPGDAATTLCPACYRRYLGSAVRATGEIMVPPLPPEADASIAELPAAGEVCSWCSKPADAVRKLLGNGEVAICDGCVALCVDVMEAELGHGWRSGS
jgi:hypothetical protein